MKYILILLFALLTSCIHLVKPDDISIELSERHDSIGYRLNSNHFRQITVECRNNTYLISSAGGDFHILGTNDTRYKYILDETEYRESINKLQFRNFEGNVVASLNLPELQELPELCHEKMLRIDQAKQKEEERLEEEKIRFDVQDRIYRNLTKGEPIYEASSPLTFDFVVSRFQNYGYDSFIGKYFWPADGSYKITQVFTKDGKQFAVLNSYKLEKMTILVITDNHPLEGQLWTNVSQIPLIFRGVTNIETIMGAEKQALVFLNLF